MAKSRIGPFALEAPLAPPTLASQMFRGIHVEQRKLAALRVFPIPLGMTLESRQAYAEQVEQLKQLRHPGIVRCYGGGFEPRKAFLAYDLIDGESLNQILERREKLPWETAIDYARQIGEALEYAHRMNWPHGRLQPSKILVTNDGVIKVSDWRRDEISTILNSPASIEQLQMTAPEVLSGELPDEKSDLYSLGCLIYTMLTGQPPFPIADAPTNDLSKLAERIRSSPIPSVAVLVLDCPVWLNAIVEQLLAPAPKQRPFGFTAFLMALREAERRQSEGVGVLQHAASGFSPLHLNVDRAEAEKVLGIRPKKEKRESDSTFWESPWMLLVGLLLAVSSVVWFMLPPSEESLYRKAEKLLASEKWTDWNEARDENLQAIVERFPEGKYREWADEKIAWINARDVERRMERDERLGRKDDWTHAQFQYAEAKQYESFGDSVTALEKYRAIQTLFGKDRDAQPIVFLASEGIQQIGQAGGRNSLQDLLQKKMDDADQAMRRSDRATAKLTWEAIIQLYEGKEQVAPIVEQAKTQLAELSSR